MIRPRTEPPEVRRREILDAARAVLVRKGYQAVSLDDVAQAAGVAKGTLYLHFKDKDDLFAAVLADLLDRLEERLGDIPATLAAQERLRRVVEAQLDFADENRDFLAQLTQQKSLLCDMSRGKTLKDRFGDHVKFIAGIVQQGIKEGRLRGGDPLEGAFFLMSLVRMAQMRKLLTDSQRPLREDAPGLLRLFLQGAGQPQ